MANPQHLSVESRECQNLWSATPSHSTLSASTGGCHFNLVLADLQLHAPHAVRRLLRLVRHEPTLTYVQVKARLIVA